MKIFDTIKTTTKKAAHSVKVHSPEICLVVGLAAGVGAIVAAIKATQKVEPVLDKAKDEIERLNGFKEEGKIQFTVDAANEIEQVLDFDEDDYRKAVVKCWMRTLWELAKIYGWTVALELLSITCIYKGVYKEQHERIAAAVADASIARAALEAIRTNFLKDHTEEEWDKYRYGLEEEEYEEVVTDEKTGKTKTVKRKDNVASDDPLHRYSEYARYWKPYDPETGTGSDNYEKNMEYNLAFIRKMIANCSTDYVVDEHMYLDQFWRAIGYRGKNNSDKKARRVGWAFNHPNCHSKDGITVLLRVVRRKVQDYNRNGELVYRYENWIVIDPQVDGMIDQYVFNDNVIEEDPNTDCPF